MFPNPKDVLIKPSPSRSIQVLYLKGGFKYCPVGFGVLSELQRVPPRTSPTRVTDPFATPLTKPFSSRFVTQTLPYLSTVVLEGLRNRPFGEVKYSPITAPVFTLILAI